MHYFFFWKNKLICVGVPNSSFAMWQASEIVLLTMPFFKKGNKHVANWISLNLSVYKGLDSFCIVSFYLLFFQFFGSCGHLFILFWTGNSKSCGLPPECNIHCYVLDVSMPKHTMHCTPDLLTVSPWWFIYDVITWSCCWLVDLNPHPTYPTRPPQCSPHVILTYVFEDSFVIY